MDQRHASACCIGVLVATLLPGADAFASGFGILAQGGQALGNAFSGQAAADDVSTVWYNPAGMLGLDGTRVAVVTNAIQTSFEYHDEGSTGAFALEPNDGGNGGGGALVPQIYGVHALGNSWRVGIAINPPFGLKTEYDEGWRGQFVALKSEAKSYNVNPAVAYRVNERLWLGGGVSFQHFEADLTNFAGPAGVARLQAADDSWGFNFGVITHLGDRARLGVSYRSSVDYDLDGDARFAAGGGLLDSGARAELAVPQSAAVSLFMPVGERWQWMANTTWTRWSRVKELTVIRTSASALGPEGSIITTLPFEWKDAWFLSVGANYLLKPGWKLRFGIASDPGVTSVETRTPRLPDEDRLLLTLGISHEFSWGGTLDVAYGHEFVSDAAISDAVPGVGVLAGSFDNSADVLSVQYTHHF